MARGTIVIRGVSCHWRVSVAGEPDPIGTVWAADAATARELGTGLLEQHRRLLGLEEGILDPQWVRVTPATDDANAGPAVQHGR